MKKLIKVKNHDGDIKVGLYAKKVNSNAYKIFLKIRKNHSNDCVEYDTVNKSTYSEFVNHSDNMLYGIIHRFGSRIGCKSAMDFFSLDRKKKK